MKANLRNFIAAACAAVTIFVCLHAEARFPRGTFPTVAPTVLPQQGNLVYKLSADSLALSNGANVTSWADSQNGITAGTLLGTAPTFQTNVQGGKPSVRCGGSGGLSIATPGALKTAVDGGAYTVLI